MNKTLFLPLVIGGVAVIAVVAYFVMKQMTSITPNMGIDKLTTSESSLTQTSMQQRSLMEFFAAEENQECTFTTLEMNEQGKVYTANGKVRGDFHSSINGTVTPSHMIFDGTDIYIWVEGQTGIKMKFADIAYYDKDAISQQVDLDRSVEYECHPSTPDDSQFIVPTDIEFATLDNLFMQGEASSEGQMNLESTKAQQCAACDSAPVSAQAQCKQMFGCN